MYYDSKGILGMNHLPNTYCLLPTSYQLLFNGINIFTLHQYDIKPSFNMLKRSYDFLQITLIPLFLIFYDYKLYFMYHSKMSNLISFLSLKYL